MIKSVTPAVQKFSDLPSEVFFIIPSVGNANLYQTKLMDNGYNAVVLTETNAGQRGHNYRFTFAKIEPDIQVTRVDVLGIEVLVSPKSV